MTKVAIFTGSDLKTFGGGEKYVIELVNRLDGFDVTIFSYHGKPPFRKELGNIERMTDARIEYYGAFEIPIAKERLMLTSSGMRALGKLKGFDVVYSLDNSFFTNLFLIGRAKRYGFKYILGIHDANILRERPINNTFARRMLLRLYSPLRNFGIMRAPNVRVINEVDGETLRRLGYKGNIYNITDFVNVSKASPKVNGNKFIVLFVGRFSVEHKGIDLLEVVIDSVLKSNGNVYFHIVGSGDNGEGIVKGLVKRHSKNVKWLGFVSESELEEEYKNADFIVFPSRFESFGLTLAEGQAYGLPAVVFNVRGPDVIMNDKVQGRLIPPFDTDAFVEEVLEYYDLWKKDKKNYLKIKKSISGIIIDRFGADRILPKIRRMLSAG